MSGLRECMQQMLMIPALKLEARKHYEAYEKVVGEMTCGRSLAKHISVEAARHSEAFNAAMERLSAIDGNCPKFRL